MTSATQRDAMLALAERCEAASGPDREIDRLIAENRHPGWGLLYDLTHTAPRYTASIDAAMALPPEGEQWNVASYPWAEHTHKAAAWVGNKRGPAYGSATPALALCVAALRSIAGRGE